jgi:hypothetical protein
MFRFAMLHESDRWPKFGLVHGTFGTLLAVNPFWLNNVAQEHFRDYTRRLRTPFTPEDEQRRQAFSAFMAVRKAAPPPKRKKIRKEK